MLRERSNSTWIRVTPSELAELIEVTPAIKDNWPSSGVATEVAMVSALAPGRFALMRIVGMSTCGTPAIGNTK